MECTVVADGTKRYEEVGTGGMKTCRLQNEKGTYVFTLFKVNDLVRILVQNWEEVAALPTNRIAYLRYGGFLWRRRCDKSTQCYATG